MIKTIKAFFYFSSENLYSALCSTRQRNISTFSSINNNINKKKDNNSQLWVSTGTSIDIYLPILVHLKISNMKLGIVNFYPVFILNAFYCWKLLHIYINICHFTILYIYDSGWQYIYIYIYCHPLTDCFVVWQLFSVARHVGRLKLVLKPAQLYIRLSIILLSQQATSISSGIIMQ